MRDGSMTHVGASADHLNDDPFLFVPTAARKRSDIRQAIKMDYECPKDLSRPKRARHFLAWLAKNYEGIFCAWQYVHMAITGYAKAPLANSKEVQSLRNAADSIRKALREWGLFLVSARDGSVRATFDDTDATRMELTRLTTKHRRSGQKLREAFEIIDPAKITDPKLRAWVMTDVRKIVKALPGVERKLAPPMLDDDDDDKK